MRLNSFLPLILSLSLHPSSKTVAAATRSSSSASRARARHHDGRRRRRRSPPSAFDRSGTSPLGFIVPPDGNDAIRLPRGGGGSSNDDTLTEPRRTTRSTITETTTETLPPIAFASAMSFLASYSHVMCLAKFKAYSSMMSGNILASSRALADGRWSDFRWACSLFGSYFGGVVAVRCIELTCRRRAAAATAAEASTVEDSRKTTVGGAGGAGAASPAKSNDNPHLRIVAPIAAAIFAIADRLMSSSSSSSPTNNNNRNHFAILVLGYSMVYTAANAALKPMTMTQLVTGHLTRVGNAFADRVLEGREMWNDAGTTTSACILVSFAGGGALGAKSLGWMHPEEVPTFAMLGVVYAMLLAMF